MDPIDYYNKYASEYYDHTVELNMEEMLERFSEKLPEGASVLDLGCGSGRDSLYFTQRGFDVTALDGALNLCELASIHIGQDVLNLTYEEMDFEDVFDGIWACSSLVHLTKEELEPILSRIVYGMKDNAILYMSFRYGDTTQILNERFFQNYTTRMLREIISRQENLEIIEIMKTPDVRPDKKENLWVNVFARKVKEKV